MSIDLSNFQKRINRVDTSIRNEFDLALIGDLFHALSTSPPDAGGLREALIELGNATVEAGAKGQRVVKALQAANTALNSRPVPSAAPDALRDKIVAAAYYWRDWNETRTVENIPETFDRALAIAIDAERAALARKEGET